MSVMASQITGVLIVCSNVWFFSIWWRHHDPSISPYIHSFIVHRSSIHPSINQSINLSTTNSTINRFTRPAIHPSIAWWRNQMETFSALLAICAGNSPVPGEFPTQRPVTRSFDVFFDLRPNERLSKHWRGWWFGLPSCPLWRHCNDLDRCHGSRFRLAHPDTPRNICTQLYFDLICGIGVPFTNMDGLNPAGISNYSYFDVLGEITYPQPNFNGVSVEVWEWRSNFIQQHFISDVIINPYQ